VYLFVDAGYLRPLMKDRLSAFLGVEVGIFWEAVKDHIKASRVFVYDAVDEEPKPGETPEAFSDSRGPS
jgi:hypothetical protein